METSRFAECPSLRQRLRAWYERRLNPGYGTCGRCRRPWGCVQEHKTWYRRSDTGGSAAFALCEDCWKLLGSPEHRLPYYEANHKRFNWSCWDEIKAAVEAGQ